MQSRKYNATQFELSFELGRGAFGVVYLAVDKLTNKQVAIKQIDLESTNDISEIQQEIRMLSTCNHPNITQYQGCFMKGYKLWIIMEYLGAGSCSDLLTAGPFSELIISFILRSVLEALVYLHDNGKIHRDIKAANILIGLNGEVKLGDFGVATQLSNNLSKRNTFVGTPYWMAPEIIKHEEYNFTADIWSLGITAIELAYGKPPLSQFHPFDVLFKISDDPAPTLGSGFSEEFQDFVNKCLKKNPRDREQARQLLNHSFIKKAELVDRKAIRGLLEKKRKWDLEQGTLDRRYYIPTAVESVRDNFKDNDVGVAWDLNTDTLRNLDEGMKTLKMVPQSPIKGESINKPEFDEGKEQCLLLRKELNSVLNQSFNKVSHKYSLSTSQYDQLVKFQTILMDSFVLNADAQYREVFGKFFKLILKKIMKSANIELKDKILPKYYLGEEQELRQLKEKSENRERDEIEELLLTRWAENIIENQ